MLQPTTRVVRCAVDARALENFLAHAAPGYADEVPKHKDGTSYGLTRRQLVRRHDDWSFSPRA